MSQTSLRGHRIQIAGSATENCNEQVLNYAHDIVSAIVRESMNLGAGFVITMGAEPKHSGNEKLPTIFDWRVLETFVNNLSQQSSKWPAALGPAIIAVGLPKWRMKIPPNRLELWEGAIERGILELIQVPAGLSVGGVLRQIQSRFGDILIPIEGPQGVEHLAALYHANHKAILPLDLLIQEQEAEARGGVRLYKLAIEDTSKFFEIDPSINNTTASFSTLSLRYKRPSPKNFGFLQISFKTIPTNGVLYSLA